MATYGTVNEAFEAEHPAKDASKEFTNISLEGDAADKERKRGKKPRRILHFSDGILEEYSTDEEEEEKKKQLAQMPVINPKTLKWMPWFWYYMMAAAAKTLSVADTCGEKLAWFFGITAPKYQYAIDEYYRLKAEEESETKKREMSIKPEDRLTGVDVEQDPKPPALEEKEAEPAAPIEKY